MQNIPDHILKPYIHLGVEITYMVLKKGNRNENINSSIRQESVHAGTRESATYEWQKDRFENPVRLIVTNIPCNDMCKCGIKGRRRLMVLKKYGLCSIKALL